VKSGNWVPLSKAFVRKLPRDREFSELEAMFSLSVDYDNDSSASISGYASLWGWSRKRVVNYLKKHGVEIVYSNKFNPHERGQVRRRSETGRVAGRGQVEFIDSKGLPSMGNRPGAGEAQVESRLGSSTNDPNPNPIDNVEEVNDSRPQMLVKEIVHYLNEKTSRSYRPGTSKTQSLIKARFKEGFTLDDFKVVIDRKVADWMHDANMAQYLRPETLFGTKFEGYLQCKQSNGTVSPDCEICDYRHRYNCQKELATCKSFIPIAN
jgi:uncharacterized phage protein (TIGR02220 family)